MTKIIEKEKPSPQIFENRIREQRKRFGLTLKQLGDALGTTPQTVQRLETGNMTVSMTWLLKIARHLEIEVQDLLPQSTSKISRDHEFLKSQHYHLIKARNVSLGKGCDPTLIFEEAGRLASALLEWRAAQVSERDWATVVNAASQLSATIMRLATDGEA